MATVYFTSNADSGAGTLRAALASAEAGDVIMPDPNVFTSGPVVISCSTTLVTQLDVTIDGGSIGIVLDGQNTNISAVSLANAGETTLVNCTIKRFKRTSAAPVYLNNAGAILNLRRCLIADNSNRYYGAIYVLRGTINLYDCLVTGNDITTNSSYAALCLATNGYATATRSTIAGNVRANVSGTSRLTNANSFIGLTPPTIDGTTPEEIGFVTPPPAASIPFGEYTEGDWQSWDFRLKPTSPYLTGAAYQTGDLDLLGHPRTGSWGAYDGSWFVVPANGTATIASNITVDYAEIGAGATVNFSAADLFLSVKKSASIASSVLSAPTGGNGYLAVPVGTNISAATLTRVKAAAYGAGVDNLDYVYPEVFYAATDMTIPVLLEYRVGSSGAWTTVANIAESPYTYAVTSTRNIRLFDGIGFYTAVAESPEPGPGNSYYELAAKTNVGYLVTKNLTGYLKTRDTVGYLN